VGWLSQTPLLRPFHDFVTRHSIAHLPQPITIKSFGCFTVTPHSCIVHPLFSRLISTCGVSPQIDAGHFCLRGFLAHSQFNRVHTADGVSASLSAETFELERARQTRIYLDPFSWAEVSLLISL